MKATRGIRRVAGRLVLVNAMVLAVASTAAAQEPQAPRPGGGAQEGVTVHGRWVVEVQNPDGSVASHTEFNNALAGGAQHIVSLLGRQGVGGRWVVYLSAQSGASGQTSPCQGGTGGSFENSCRIVEGAATNHTNGTAESRDLTVSPVAGSLTLTGTITALSDGLIGRVSTGFAVCTTATPIASCNVAGGGPFFSDATLGTAGKPAPVPVVAGQIIKITVTFTFS